MLDSELSGIIYILDEPTAGLHEDDTNRVIDAMRALRERDNTVIVIEHDTQVIRAADYIVEIGPGAGREGGEVVYQGPAANISQASGSIIRGYLEETFHSVSYTHLETCRIPAFLEAFMKGEKADAV